MNIKRVAELSEQGLMRPSGLKAFEARAGERSGVYAYEQETVVFDSAQETQFRAREAAWEFFQKQAAWYRRTATWWVISAKRAETREKRLATLIGDSENGKTIAQLTRERPVRRKNL